VQLFGQIGPTQPYGLQPFPCCFTTALFPGSRVQFPPAPLRRFRSGSCGHRTVQYLCGVRGGEEKDGGRGKMNRAKNPGRLVRHYASYSHSLCPTAQQPRRSQPRSYLHTAGLSPHLRRSSSRHFCGGCLALLAAGLVEEEEPYRGQKYRYFIS
jgi:hypothetical protein